MILLTIGTYPLAFDRMVKTIDEMYQKGEIKEKVFAQIGYGNYEPKFIPFERLMEKEVFDETLASASALIGHAGMGTISLALKHNKPLLVMPRLKKFGEHVNNHQVDTAHKFEDLGHVLAAYEVEEISEKLKLLESFSPKPRINQADQISKRINQFLRHL